MSFSLTKVLPETKNDGETTGDVDTSGGPLDLLNPDFLISFCNDHFRLRRNAKLLSEEGETTKELRSIIRSLKKVDELLEKNGIQCIDLTDEPYDDGRNDFDLLGEPEKIPGLREKIILRVERPAIWLNGKLIQQARGIVARPA